MITLTKEEKDILTKNRNMCFIDIPEELQEFMLENGGYTLSYEKTSKSEKLKELIQDRLCSCGLKFHKSEYPHCPICGNKKFSKQQVDGEQLVDYFIHNKQHELPLKKKMFEEGYVYEKESETRYTLYREKQLYTYNWLNDKFTIIKEGNSKKIGYIEKTDNEFYVVKNKKKQSILLFAKTLRKDKTLDFIQMYNDLNKERPLPLLDVRGVDVALMIYDERVRIISEYFNAFIDIDIVRHCHTGYDYTDTIYALFYGKVKDLEVNDSYEYPFQKETYNIYTATKLNKLVIKYITKEVNRSRKSVSNAVMDLMKTFLKIIVNHGEEPSNALNLMNTFPTLGNYRGSINDFYEIIQNDHEFKHLLNYLKDIKKKQGINHIDALVYYRDYINASKDMNVAYNKYPKNLSKVHDIRMKDYNIIKDKLNDNKFKENYKKKPIKIDTIDDYIFITPKEAKELTIEGQSLNHCVASYVNKVINNHSLIYFLRNKEYPHIPLVTIEYKVNSNEIIQVRGKFNRNAYADEKMIIQKWAKLNNMEY